MRASPPAPGRTVPIRLTLWLLMLGNLTIGTGVLAPTGLLDRLAVDFHTSIAQAGSLIWAAAIVLGIGAPALAWLLARVDRRPLLAACFLLYVVGYGVSTLITDFTGLLVVRLVTVMAAAIYTPQAAAVVALLMPPEQRAGGVAFVFLGWSLASAFGMPAAAYIGSVLGWQTAYGAIAVAALVQSGLLWWALPSGLITPRISLNTWRDVLRSPLLLRILLVTVVVMTAQFVVLTYLAPELKRMLDVGPLALAILLSIYGSCGVLGNVIAARLAGSIPPGRILQITLISIATGLLCWANGNGQLAIAGLGLVLWGLGGFASISIQQSRLIMVAPSLAPATASLNSSALYLGQAIGGIVASLLIALEMNAVIGWVGAMLAAAAWLIARCDPV